MAEPKTDERSRAAGLSSDTLKRTLWTFAEGFLAGFIVAVTGTGPIKDFNGAKAALIGGLIGGIAAGFSALKNVLTPHDSKLR